ncbi:MULTISPECIES: DUF3710 domain-containing protein [unclassified Isoptericola]|uniref:DUF3710 domain-containing protein n=1 Tax=unclassified Isoptericola TaxID=2623355 RepID=UPI002712A78A|nr:MULTISPECIES: DUF3710 domain-containing protein [unclassified Isoptericola]MDO8145152.1 DUF3710 domain-containing protein [Isoptericola sp. 178]MDO8151270.1 DUF3710 domain-containing protein [Isoptericola sp. b408]
MGLFRRKASTKDTESAAADATSTSPTPDDAPAATGSDQGEESARPTGRGPFDSSQVSSLGARVDLGAIWLPVLPGLQLRMEVDKKSQKVTGVAASLKGSILQVQAFAAPKTMGIWDEVREEIAASLTKQGGTVDDVPGTFGRELIARIPAQTSEGKTGVRPARFIGVDGPRWFLRGVLSGRAAVDADAAKPLESVFANVVVVRDGSPRPPRDLLTLTLPEQKRAAGAESDGPAGATPQEPSFDPLQRGPEITETR